MLPLPLYKNNFLNIFLSGCQRGFKTITVKLGQFRILAAAQCLKTYPNRVLQLRLLCGVEDSVGKYMYVLQKTLPRLNEPSSEHWASGVRELGARRG